MLRNVIKTYHLIEVVPKRWSYGFGPNFDPSRYYHRHRPGEYNALIEHSRFTPKITNNLIRNPVYFTVLRNPETRFLSAFDYYPEIRKCAGGIDVTPLDVLDNPSLYYSKLQNCKQHYLIMNSMAYEMGINAPYSESDVRAKIEEMEKEFSLVMILEYSEESIVMLRRTMNWKLSDVVNVPSNSHPDFKSGDKNASDYEKLIAHHEAKVLKEKHKKVLRQWMHADFLIYEHFLKVFQTKIRKEEESTGDFLVEVQMYKEAMVALCKGKTLPILKIPLSKRSHRHQVRPLMAKWYEKLETNSALKVRVYH